MQPDIRKELLVLKPIKKNSVAEAVIEQILAEIRTGRFVPGRRIPSERELTETLKVSRTALREAVKQLQAIGILDVRRGDGTYVDDLALQREAVICQRIKSLFDLGEVGVQDFLHARISLECANIKLAVERAEDSELDELDNLHRSMYLKFSDRPGYAKDDLKFHCLICELSKNKVLERFLFSIMDLLSEQILRSVLNHVCLEESWSRHGRIIAALHARDAKEAEKAIMEHILPIPRKLLGMLPDDKNIKDFLI